MKKDCFWMLSALLEYTSHNTMPPVFADQGQVTLPQNPTLPERMEGNHLHRYSKVIEGHMGTPRSRPLPPCPNLMWAKPNVLNISAPSNLYQPQKLLSVNSLDLGHLPLHTAQRENLLDPEVHDIPAQEVNIHHDSQELDMDKHAVFPIVAFLGTALVILFMLNQYYKGRSKPKRKRPRNMKKFPTTLIYGHKVPSV